MTESLVGTSISFEWTATQADVTAFARLSGDDHPIHLDAAAARAAGLADTIVQGTFMVGLMGRASTAFFRAIGRNGLAVGFDRLRFLKPVPMGTTLTGNYLVETHDPATGRLTARVTLTDAAGALVAVATHLGKVV